jgi:hypothetical protein
VQNTKPKWVVAPVKKNSIITGRNFNFNQCLWRQIQTIRLNGGIKKKEQFQIKCRICAPLAHPLINKAEEVRFMIMENIQQNKKLTLFIDYCTQQWMENQNVPIEMWNTNKHRHRSNNSVEAWNSKLSSVIGKQQPNLFLLVQRLNGETDLVLWQVKSKASGQSDQQRRKTYVKQEERIK